MNLHQAAIGFSLLSASSMFHCERGDGASSDPLAGTWRSDACFGTPSTPAEVERCSVELTFTNGLIVELKAKWISLAATAENPGCTITRRVTGQRWSTNHAARTLTVTGSGIATIERSGCIHAEDNLDPRPTTDIEILPGEMRYELDGNMLRVLTGSLQGTYTR
jgi:hypothetical protein